MGINNASNNTFLVNNTFNSILENFSLNNYTFANFSSYIPEQVYVVTDFIEKNQYDFNLPASDPKNMVFLIAAPIATIAALSITTRSASGVLALCTKGISLVANVANETTKAIEKSMDKTADKLRSIASASFLTETLATLAFTVTALGIIGLSMLSEPSTELPLGANSTSDIPQNISENPPPRTANPLHV